MGVKKMGDNKKQRKQASESGSSTPSKKQKKAKASPPATSSSRGTKSTACATKSGCWFSWVWSIICFFVPAVVFALLWWAFKAQIDIVMEGYVVPAIHTVVLPIFPKLTPASAAVS